MKKEQKYKEIQNSPKPITSETKKKAINLVINSLILLVIYYGAMGLENTLIQRIVMISYMVVFGALLISYIAYNRAFTRKNITKEMLPDTWSNEEKETFINDGKERIRKSAWMLTLIFPLLVTFMCEALYLFVWTGFLENYFK